MNNIERIRQDFPDHKIDYQFCDPDYDDEVVILIDGRYTSIYDSQEDLLSDDADDFEYLHKEITEYLDKQK